MGVRSKGGNQTHRYTYSGSNNLNDVAWYEGNEGMGGSKYTHKVGTKDANELGLYDMSGNVWEWCNDFYGGSYYSISPTNNPQGSSTGVYRVMRGGSWAFDAWDCRVARRLSDQPTSRNPNVGFRVVSLP